jgi:hypothetical protein
MVTKNVSLAEAVPGQLEAESIRAVDRFAQLVIERAEALSPASLRVQVSHLIKQAAAEARASLVDPAPSHVAPKDTLPTTKLRTSDVLGQGLVDMSQASLYRAAESGRFYCTKPKGRNTGMEFPAWQFVEPVPELISSILEHLAGEPASEIHAFWVTKAEELNDLSPAETLAGKPFETRGTLHPSQRAFLSRTSNVRLLAVQDAATRHFRRVTVVG